LYWELLAIDFDERLSGRRDRQDRPYATNDAVDLGRDRDLVLGRHVPTTSRLVVPIPDGPLSVLTGLPACFVVASLFRAGVLSIRRLHWQSADHNQYEDDFGIRT
jgi:hypothetical protein